MIMADELYAAAIQDDVGFFNENNMGRGDKYFVRKTWEFNNNILHISLRHGSWRFAVEASKRFPQLLWETTLDGKTPLHIAAELVDYSEGASFVKQVCDALTETSPLRIQYSLFLDNTLLHAAIIHNHFEVALLLLQKDPRLAEIVNASNETPLHLALKHFPHHHEVNILDGEIWLKKERFRRLMEGTETPGASDDSMQDHMGVLIGRLLNKAPNVVRLRDASGLGPLHRAVLLPTTIYNLTILEYLIRSCPQSIEVCDNTGKTFLHYLVNRMSNETEGQALILNRILGGLVNYQDEQGNTVGHLAAINNDINMLRIIQQLSHFNWHLKNKEGLSTTSLLGYHLAQLLKSGSMPKKISDAAENGDAGVLLLEECREYLDTVDSDGRNIFHKLFQLKSSVQVIIPEQMLALLDRAVEVGMDIDVSDYNGETPTHILAEKNPNNIMIHLAVGPRDVVDDVSLPVEPLNLSPEPYYYPHCYEKYTYSFTLLSSTEFFNEFIRRWAEYCGDRVGRAPNFEGNTALHQALIAKNHPVFDILAGYAFPGATSIVNNRRETLLHLLATTIPLPDFSKCVIENTIINEAEVEAHGPSILMSAIQANNVEFASMLCYYQPRIAESVDTATGQTFLHQLVEKPAIPELADSDESLFRNYNVADLLERKDKKGQTALHLAVGCGRFDLAETFLGLGGFRRIDGTPFFHERLLKIRNAEGITPADMIGELPSVPHKFEKFIRNASTTIGIRSIWGISPAQMKEYVNTMGVIAALITTIIFTAAFAVPSGFDQEKGTPLLMNEPSFQVFMFFDIVAMCLSMMVLLCLLWIMAIQKKSAMIMLLDFTIMLLRASFYATLVTFMTGLYATTHSVKLWVPVVALVLCSMLILLMRKSLVMNFIIPSWKHMLISLEEKYQYATKWRKDR